MENHEERYRRLYDELLIIRRLDPVDLDFLINNYIYYNSQKYNYPPTYLLNLSDFIRWYDWKKPNFTEYDHDHIEIYTLHNSDFSEKFRESNLSANDGKDNKKPNASFVLLSAISRDKTEFSKIFNVNISRNFFLDKYKLSTNFGLNVGKTMSHDESGWKKQDIIKAMGGVDWNIDDRNRLVFNAGIDYSNNLRKYIGNFGLWYQYNYGNLNLGLGVDHGDKNTSVGARGSYSVFDKDFSMFWDAKLNPLSPFSGGSYNLGVGATFNPEMGWGGEAKVQLTDQGVGATLGVFNNGVLTLWGEDIRVRLAAEYNSLTKNSSITVRVNLLDVFPPPILLDMGFGIETIDSGKVMYDWDEKGGRRVSTGWAGRKTGMLAVDLDGNGKIEGPYELSMARHKPGAMTDLAGLSAFDSNGDGLLSGLDAMFPKFGVWIDANQDGLTDSGEFRTLETAGISAITLEPTQVTPGRAMGKNPLHGIGRFRWADGSDGALADVAFALDRQGLSREADALSWRLDIPSGLPVPVSDLEGATAPTGSAGAYAPSRTVMPDFPGGKQKKHRHRATEWQATEWQAGQTDRLPTSSQNLPMADPPMSTPLTLPVLTLQPKRRRSLAQPAEGGQERSISLPPQPVESYRGTLTPEELYRLKHGLSLEQILRQGAGDSRLYQD